jgi:hypothetical protein
MLCSLNEIESQIKKAARGAGLSWGLAEEAGRAARWLEAHGLRSTPSFAALLEREICRSLEVSATTDGGEHWRASGVLCPIVAGAALADRAAEIAGGKVVTMGPIARPLLLAPFAAAVADAAGVGIALAWPAALLVFERAGARLEATREALNSMSASQVSCRRAAGDAPGRRLAVEIKSVPVDDAIWSRLDAIAHRTYVPASEASRLKGAGAGLLDLD